MKNQIKTRVKPEVKFLGTILSEISNGELGVPNFQRPFVWKPSDMIALFESIISGYPIGSLLFWKTENKYNSLNFLGPYKILNEDSQNINLILDGHQRLTTLYGVLTNKQSKEIINNDNFWKWEIYYDLKNENFTHIQKGEPESYHIKLSSLLKTLEFLKESRKIAEKCGSNAEKYIERAEKLTQIIREYQIAITQIEGGDLDSAVNIFSRLNSKGMKISEDRMYSALTYSEGKSNFNLSNKIDNILEKFKDYNFSGIKRMTIFRSILAASGKNIYTKGKLNIFDDKKLNIPKIVDESEKSIIKAVHFLKEDIRVPDDKFLPYNFQLIVLSEFFRICPNPDRYKKKIIRQWFWVTSFVGIYTPNTSKNTQILEEMKQFARTTDENFIFNAVNFNEKARPFPSEFNLVSSRVRAYVLFLFSLNPKSLDNNTVISHEVLKEGYEALHYIIYNKYKVSNRIILGKVKNSFAKNILSRENGLFDNISQDVLDSHAITQEAYKAIQNQNYDEFLELREKELIRLEKEFMIKEGVVPDNSNNTQIPINDAD